MARVPALCLALVSSLVAADVIHLADGTQREGRIVETTDKEVVVDFGTGAISLVTRIPRSQVVRIEKKASPQEILMGQYVARLAKAVEGGADDWHAFGLWCRQRRVFAREARKAFARAIELDPGHPAAHQALGHIKLNDAWMTRERAVALLAPHLDPGGAAKAAELEAQKAIEEANTRALEAQREFEKLKATLAQLEKDNDLLRRRLATIPPPLPPRERIIYRPFIIYRDRPRRRPDSERDAQGTGGKPAPETKPKTK